MRRARYYQVHVVVTADGRVSWVAGADAPRDCTLLELESGLTRVLTDEEDRDLDDDPEGPTLAAVADALGRAVEAEAVRR